MLPRNVRRRTAGSPAAKTAHSRLPPQARKAASAVRCAGLRSAHRERRPAPRSRPRRPADCFLAASRPGSGAQPMRPAPALPAAWPPPAAAAANSVFSFPVFHPWRSPLPLFCSSLCRHAEKKTRRPVCRAAGVQKDHLRTKDMQSVHCFIVGSDSWVPTWMRSSEQ